jgi:hypothetical protein
MNDPIILSNELTPLIDEGNGTGEGAGIFYQTGYGYADNEFGWTLKRGHGEGMADDHFYPNGLGRSHQLYNHNMVTHDRYP